MRWDYLKNQWIDMAPAWIREAREGPNSTRTGLLDAPMLRACGDVKGLSVLDCGCGEGRFCRLLAERGAAYVLGLDLCDPMITAARQLQSNTDEYRVADVQNLSFLSNRTFDLAVSYLNQCDLPDFMANNREVFRILKPDGRFIIANLHPMRSAVGYWLKTENGEKRHVILDRYFDESERHWKMMNIEFTNFHRSLATYLRGFLNAGFCIDDVVEPTVTASQLEIYPELDDELRVPNFIIYVLRKPTD
ncbi:class I SAM-dependent methyltransferase [bacterium]|nr:class I SAM-dependent methyltransferase [candidate division CSSED10-310 bacterium]